MKRALEPRILDFAAAAPVIAWLALGVGASGQQIARAVAGHVDMLAVCAELANIGFYAGAIVLFVIRRAPLRKASGWAPRAAGAAGFLSPFLAVALPKAALPPALSAVSTGIIALGAVMSVAVFCWLGRSFSVFPQARGLVTAGPYRYVRHPLYLAEIIAAFGVMLTIEAPWSFAMMAAAIAAQWPRMRYEERVLTEAFPAYAGYAQRTRRLIPGVSRDRIRVGRTRRLIG